MAQVDEWVQMARVARKEGRLADAAELYEFVAGKCEEAEAPLKGAHARRHAAELLLQAGQVPEALTAIDRVMVLYDEEGDIPPLEMANALRVKGLVEEAAGNLTVARAAWEDARELYLAENVPAGAEEADRRIATMPQSS